MRLKHLIAVAAFALVGGAAHADITLTIDPLGPLTPGNTYTVNGTITNTGSNPVGIDGTTTPPSPPIDLISDDFLNYLLGTSTGEQDINAGDSFSHSLYTFKATTPNDLITYGVSGEDLTTGAPVSATGVGSTAVPEPGSIAMLVGGAFGSGLFLLRRRRK
jgi:hypothetical protein